MTSKTKTKTKTNQSRSWDQDRSLDHYLDENIWTITKCKVHWSHSVATAKCSHLLSFYYLKTRRHCEHMRWLHIRKALDYMLMFLPLQFQHKSFFDELCFSEVNYLHKKDPILHVTTTLSLKQRETRTNSGPFPQPLKMSISIYPYYQSRQTEFKCLLYS